MRKPRAMPLVKRADVLDAQAAVLVKVAAKLIATGWAQERDDFGFDLVAMAKRMKAEAKASRKTPKFIL